MLTLRYFCCLITGAILHLHDGAMLDAHWLVENATYDDHCYICIQSQGMLFHFFKDDAAAKSQYIHCIVIYHDL